jgi:hypothetical protein
MKSMGFRCGIMVLGIIITSTGTATPSAPTFGRVIRVRLVFRLGLVAVEVMRGIVKIAESVHLVHV